MLKQCAVCGGSFDVPPMRWKRKKACSPDCARALAKERDRRNGKTKRERRRLGVPFTKPCIICSKPFTPLRNTVTCSEPCRAKAKRERFNSWVRANRDRTRATNNGQQRRRYRANLEKRRDYANDWYRGNRESILDQIKQRHLANPERRRERWRAWSRENPDHARTKNRNRHAKKMAAPGKHTAEEETAILAMQSYRCAYCGVNLRKGRTTHIDHIKALAAGGSNNRRNLQALCRQCNCSKSAKDPIEFAQSLGFLL